MLAREDIVKGLSRLINKDRVITDEDVLKNNSVDRFRKYSSLHNIFDLPLPAAVVYVENTKEVAKVLSFLNENKINCVPKTGGTATEGGLETVVENSVVLDGSKMKKIIKIDAYNMQVTAECGVILEDLENVLRKQGLTTGHSPQSKPLAQLGGLVSTRSIGQFSTLYGGIEDMVVGLESVFPNGKITRIKNVPRRAAGPDIRHVIIGNEGSLCFITEVTLKLYKYMPENNIFLGWTLDNMTTGAEVLREVVVNGFRPSVARLYSEEDAAQHFSHFANNKCVLLFMVEGAKSIARATSEEILSIVSKYGECKKVETKLIEDWFNNLNWGTEKIEAEKAYMLEHKNLGFTTEISCDWSNIIPIYESVMKRVKKEFSHAKDLTMLGAHSSHSYQTGTNLYFVYDYNIRCEPREERAEYHIPLNAIIVEEALRFGGSMVHHHGIGKYRTPWTEEEHGSSFYILETLKKAFDKNGIMNKGTIFKT